jgi:hypothetical protein
MPIGSQLVLLPPSPPEDEISLVDLWRVLARRKGIFWAVFLGLLALGVAYAFILEKGRVFRASIEIGSVPANGGFHAIEEPGTVLAKITENFIPNATAELTRQQPEYRNRLELKARIPRGSSLVVIEAEAPEAMGEVYLGLIRQVLDLVKADHAQLLARTRSAIEARLKEAQGQAQQLEEEEQLLQRRLDDLVSGEGSLTAQIQTMRQQVSEARASQAQVPADLTGEAAAIALQVAASDLRSARESLISLEEELRTERDGLREDILENRSSLRAKRMEVVTVQNQLDGLQETRAVLAPMQLPEPVGPSRMLIVAVAGVLGLLLGIMGAFFVDFLAKVRGEGGDAAGEAEA